MGDAGPTDAIRTHLKAIRAESARRDPKERDVAGLAVREQLVHRLEPLPERLAALNSRVTAKIEALGGMPGLSRKAQSDPGSGTRISHCFTFADLANAAYQTADDILGEDFEGPVDDPDALLYVHLGEAFSDIFIDCIIS